MVERRFGILIASSQFPEEPKLTPLRCPENDVDGLNEILLSKDRGEFTETWVFKNRPHHEILRSINRVLNQATKDDIVLIYYSGHGKLNLANCLHLATVDTVLGELEATSIPVDTIRNYVDVSPSNKIVLILDCCFSGAAGAAFARGSVDDQLQLASKTRGTYIMTASTGIQVAQEKESDQYGVFTKHIIDGIRGGEADLDTDGHITMEELYRYVHDKVLAENFQEPMKWDLNVRGELFIARSGKIPWQKRRGQIRELLFDLAIKGMISDDILDKAREVINLDPTKLSGELRDYNDVLEQLLQKRLDPVEFIRKWDTVGSAASRRKVKPATPKREPLKARLHEPEAIEPEALQPKPVSKPAVNPPEPQVSQPKPAAEAPTQRTFTNSIGMDFVLIPAGSFTMGSPTGEPGRDDDERRHPVTISKPFYLQTTEVTQKQWTQVMGRNPSCFKASGDDRPVETVSWNDAQELIKKLNQTESGAKYRLPTEAEWEYACRAGSERRFCFGDEEVKLGEYAWYEGNSDRKTHPVGKKKPNAWGLYDMHGNVSEWCQDWYGDYTTRKVTDPTGPKAAEACVFRGGSWDVGARYLRSAVRSWGGPDDRDSGIGFRVARDP